MGQHKAERPNTARILRPNSYNEVFNLPCTGHSAAKRHSKVVIRIVNGCNLQVELAACEGDSETRGNQSFVIFRVDLFPGMKQARG